MPRLDVDLPHNRSSASLARKHTGAVLRDAHQSDTVRNDAKLIVTELVTNAILHGRDPIRLTIIVDDVIRLEVFDGDARVEVVAKEPLDQDRTSGRGLLLVDAIADAWGSTPRPDGKTIWATLSVNE
jgi:anti-sigma regulatory factor (Ser/Thr protein kinase)